MLMQLDSSSKELDFLGLTFQLRDTGTRRHSVSSMETVRIGNDFGEREGVTLV